MRPDDLRTQASSPDVLSTSTGHLSSTAHAARRRLGSYFPSRRSSDGIRPWAEAAPSFQLLQEPPEPTPHFPLCTQPASKPCCFAFTDSHGGTRFCPCLSHHGLSTHIAPQSGGPRPSAQPGTVLSQPEAQRPGGHLSFYLTPTSSLSPIPTDFAFHVSRADRSQRLHYGRPVTGPPGSGAWTSQRCHRVSPPGTRPDHTLPVSLGHVHLPTPSEVTTPLCCQNLPQGPVLSLRCWVLTGRSGLRFRDGRARPGTEGPAAA